MKNKALCVILAVLMMLSLTAVSVSAAQDDNRMPALTDEPKSLAVYFYIQKTGVDTPIQGAHIAVCQIANLTVRGGSAEYEVLPAYDSLQKLQDGKDVTFNGITGSESQNLAKLFFEIVEEPEHTGITDAVGICRFDIEKPGMYLVWEVAAEGDAENYEEFAPYLISVPLADRLTEDNQWLYEVITEPKTKVEEKSKPESSEPESSEPESSEPESSEPESSEPESSQPESSEPESSVPESSQPEYSEPVSKPASDPSIPSTPSQPTEPSEPFITGENSAVLMVIGIVCISVLGMMLFWRKKSKDSE